MNENPKPRTLGVIPARGGSKRLPRKNVRDLNGAPLIAYTIAAAAGAANLTDWLVSSDDDEIMAAAQSYGAPVPYKRPAELGGDEIRNNDVMLHALDHMEAATGAAYDVIVLLQPTCPIRQSAHIDTAIESLQGSDLDTVASVKGPFKKRDPNLKRIRDGVLEDYCGTPPGPDWEPFYIYNASIYAMRCDWFRRERKFVSARQIPLVMDEYHSIDVDTEADFQVAEALVRHLNIPTPKEINQ
ncbi:MAG: acylneuraminate cytidylyltransferase family protein [Alphaproteobacteria bacterium]